MLATKVCRQPLQPQTRAQAQTRLPDVALLVLAQANGCRGSQWHGGDMKPCLRTACMLCLHTALGCPWVPSGLLVLLSPGHPKAQPVTPLWPCAVGFALFLFKTKLM